MSILFIEHGCGLSVFRSRSTGTNAFLNCFDYTQNSGAADGPAGQGPGGQVAA
jgi:hypothetical protein